MFRIASAVVFPLVVMAGLCAPGRASASPTWFQFGPVESADIVTLHYAAAGLNGQYYAGQYKGTEAATQAGLSGASAQTCQTFCVDLSHDASNNQQYEVALTATVPALNHGRQINYMYL